MIIFRKFIQKKPRDRRPSDKNKLALKFEQDTNSLKMITNSIKISPLISSVLKITVIIHLALLL